MNENNAILRLRDFMVSPEGWGREQGRIVYQKLVDFVESRPEVMIFKIILEGVRRTDISFASETLVEVARRFRGKKGFCFVDLDDQDIEENWEAAAERKKQPFVIWTNGGWHVIGIRPSQGCLSAFEFAMGRTYTRAAEFAVAFPEISIANASTKFKQLWEQGFLLRQESTAESGGVEFNYRRIG